MTDNTSGILPMNAYKFPPAAYENFFRVLAKTGNRAAAAASCGVHRTTISRRVVQDPKFKEGLEQAKAMFVASLEAEALRRGVQGVTQTKPGVGNTSYQVTTYSDALLIHMLKKADPKKHGDKIQVEHEAPEMPIGLESLTEENQDRLRIILESSVETEPKRLEE